MKIFLFGGFGNLLFQINYCYYLREQYPNRKINCSDFFIRYLVRLTKCLRYTDHKSLVALENFNIKTTSSIYDIPSVIKLSLSKVFGKEWLKSKCFGRTLPSEDDIQNLKNVFGYFQHNACVSEKFTKMLLDRINNPLFNHLERPAVAIHFRGGDIPKNNDDKLISYYSSALKNVRHATIVTDDVVRAKLFFVKFCPWLIISISSGQTEVEDFVILSRAKYLVASNSTFCWWAAEICQGEVVQPKELHYQRDVGSAWNPVSNRNRIEI